MNFQLPAKLKSFTLPELLLTMTLLAIMLFMGQQMYRIFFSFQKKYVEAVADTYDAALLQHQIQEDVNQAYDLYASNSQRLCLLDKYGERTHCYEFTDSLLYRIHKSKRQGFPIKGYWELMDAKDAQVFTLVDSVKDRHYLFTLPQRSRVRIISD